ncbi:MAG: MarR family transcriptional regulator [Anaerolineae bacterium]|nr:MarR family transcriptional regulator [Anaerolineae bacterium]
MPPSQSEIQEARNTNIGRLFIRAHRDFQLRSIEKLQALGYQDISTTHATVLMYIDLKGTRIITLAERAGMTKQSMGQLVGELEAGGYVQRMPDPDDKRAVLVQFTESGQRFLQDAYHIKQAIEAEYIALLGEDGFLVLRDLLARLLETSVREPIE